MVHSAPVMNWSPSMAVHWEECHENRRRILFKLPRSASSISIIHLKFLSLSLSLSLSLGSARVGYWVGFLLAWDCCRRYICTCKPQKTFRKWYHCTGSVCYTCPNLSHLQGAITISFNRIEPPSGKNMDIGELEWDKHYHYATVYLYTSTIMKVHKAHQSKTCMYTLRSFHAQRDSCENNYV